ncbi:MAG: hypothetical protein JW751_02045 [Polyangiaceae bacterium]|nr:hypothetical protein [Polyangiaceae bacterium]
MHLRIVEPLAQTIGIIHGLCRVIARQDPDLSRQMKRAVHSLGLNSGEGLSARGGHRTVRLESAMASGREVIFGLRIAGAAGHVAAERVAREVDVRLADANTVSYQPWPGTQPPGAPVRSSPARILSQKSSARLPGWSRLRPPCTRALAWHELTLLGFEPLTGSDLLPFDDAE